MPVITSGNSATARLGASQYITIQAPGGVTASVLVDGAKVAEVSGERTVGPYPGRSVQITANGGSVAYELSAGGVAATRRTGGNTVVVYGTSTNAYNNVVDSGFLSNTQRGIFAWANAFLGQRLTLLANKSVAGQNNDYLKANLDADVLAYSPDWVWLHAGANDIYQRAMTGEAVMADIQAVCERILATGAKVVLFIPQKWNSADAMLNANTNREYFRLAHLLRQYAAKTPNVVLVDGPSVIVDSASNVGDQKTNHFIDSKHLSNTAAKKIGKLAANALSSMIPAIDTMVYSPLECSANLAGHPQLVSDVLQGTTDTTAVTGSSGTKWSQMSFTRTTGTPTLVASMVAAPFGPGQATRLAITWAADNNRWTVNLPSGWASELAVGDRFVLEARIRVASGSTGLRCHSLYMTLGDGKVISDLNRDTVSTGNDKALEYTEDDHLVLRTPVYQVTSGFSVTAAGMALMSRGTGTTTIDIYQVQVRKLAPDFPVIY